MILDKMNKQDKTTDLKDVTEWKHTFKNSSDLEICKLRTELGLEHVAFGFSSYTFFSEL